MSNRPVIETERAVLEILSPEKAELMQKYYLDNAEHLLKWEPARDDYFFELDNWQKLLQRNIELYNGGNALMFSALNKERTKVLGTCNFNNVVQGVFQACHLGYSIGEPFQGKGLMFEILNAGIGYVFNEFGLHRVMANYMPHNLRSGALLSRLGFEKEGTAKSYLKIAGQWQDHILTSKINTRSE